MSIFKHLALAALVLCLPLAAFANSNVDFGNVGGTLTAVNGGTAISLTGSTLATVSGFNGGALITGNLGTVTFTTGAISGSLATGGTFAPGGSFVVTTTGSNGLPNGVLFSGSFTSGTWAAVPAGSKTSFTFTGVINGTFASGYQTTGVTIQLTTISAKNPFRVGGNGKIALGSGNTVAAVPEPGSLTLLGTGLIGLAGVVRRKLAGMKV